MMKHDTEDCPVCIQKGGGRESGGGLGTTKRALPQVEPVAAANPAACPYCLILEPEEH